MNSTPAAALAGTNATGAIVDSMAAVAGASVVAPPPPSLMCLSLSPLERSWTCSVGSEPASLLLMSPPAWVLLSHSAQGILGLFSVKHLALSLMPLITSWTRKLATLRTAGRYTSQRPHPTSGDEGAEGLAAAFMPHDDEEASHASTGARHQSALPQLLLASGAEEAKRSPRRRRDTALPDESAGESTTAAASSMPVAAVPSHSGASSSSSTSGATGASSASSRSSAHTALLHRLFLSSASDRLSALGKNMLEHVLSFSSARELAVRMSVSMTWYRSCNADHLWSALHRQEIVSQFLSKDNGLSAVIRDLDEKERARVDASFQPRVRDQKMEWQRVLNKHQTKLRVALATIANTWHIHLLSITPGASSAHLHPPHQHLSVTREDIEQEYMEATHRLTEIISKINAHLSYTKQAEKHARAAWEVAFAAAANEREAAALKPPESFTSDTTSALLLTSCALVQAVHRFCSGSAPTTMRPRTSESASEEAAAAAVDASLEQSMAHDADVLNQVLQEQDGLRRRKKSDAPVPTPMQRASSTAAASSTSAPPPPPLERSMSTPQAARDCSSSSSSSSAARRSQTVADVLLLMETSGLVHFQFSVEQALRVYEEARLEEEQKSQDIAALVAGPLGEDDDFPSSDEEDDDEDDGASSVSSSDFDEDELAHHSDHDDEHAPAPVPAPDAIPPATGVPLLTVPARSVPKRVVFVADIDDVGSIFINAQEIPMPPPAAPASSSSSSSSSAAPLTEAKSASASSSSPPFSDRATSLAAMIDQIDAAKAASAAASAAKKAKKPSGHAAAKLAFKDALQFLKLQKSIDQHKRDETKLQRSQVQTMRLHETLRMVFKGGILAAMLLNNQSVLHLLLRYCPIAFLVVTVLQLCGVDFGFGALQANPNQQLALAGIGAGGPGQVHLGQLNGNVADADDADDPLADPPQAFALNFAFDLFAAFGFTNPPPPPPPAVNPNQLNFNAPGPIVPPVNQQVAQQKRWRRLALAFAIILAVEAFNWTTGRTDPEWFIAFQLSALRAAPLLMLSTQLLLLCLGELPWRHRAVQLWFASTIALEVGFWSVGFRQESMDALWSFVGVTILPRLWKVAVFLARTAPVTAALSSILFTLGCATSTIVPHVLNAHGLDPDFGLGLVWRTLRDAPLMRQAYKLMAVTCLSACILETVYSHFDFSLPFLADLTTRVQAIAPFVSALVREIFVFESRGLLVGLAVARCVWVVDQSLPIATLTLLKQPSRAATARRKRTNGNGAHSSTEAAGAHYQPDNEEASSTQPRDAPPGPPKEAGGGARIVCLSCLRHRQPFRVVRWLQDLIFETSLLLSHPLHGVQGVMVQKKEIELAMVDLPQAPSEHGHGEEEEGEGRVHMQTCVDHTLHSIKMQLFLPIFYCALLVLVLSRLFPTPAHSTYRALLSASLHYLFDRVPLLVLFDLVIGWWQGRTLRYKRAYLLLSGLILSYAFGLAAYSYAMDLGSWWLMPGFFYQSAFLHSASLLAVDIAWVAVWILN